jgi:hypothetical protein
VVAVAPAAPGSWTLTLTVTDKAGLEATTQLTLQVQPSGLRVEIPAVPGSLVLAAGASSSASGVVATITNDGAAPAKVRVDLGPLSGAAARAPDGILEVGWTVAGNTTWTPYHGAWMPVADLASHAAATLAFRLTADGLPAGTYGTSFSVVAT